MQLSRNRIEALTDGVFAVAMTLLVLDIKVPELQEPLATAELPVKMLALWPKYADMPCHGVTSWNTPARFPKMGRTGNSGRGAVARLVGPADGVGLLGRIAARLCVAP